MRLSDDWTLHHRLGAGGFGEVWEASTAAHGVRVAIKVLPPRHQGHTLTTLPPEVGILASLRHPGVVRLLDAGVVETSLPGIPRGSAWLAMEKVAGRSLSEVRLDGGSRSLLAVLYHLLDTTAYLHSRGYIHGDLSPSNVLWSLRDWNVKVVDFGLARSVGHQSTHTVGTPGFLAPERRAGAPLAPSADLYSIGRLGLHLLERHHPAQTGLHGVPVDRLARWLQTLASDQPHHRPPRAAEARAWLTELVGPPPTLRLEPTTPCPSETSRSGTPIAQTAIPQNAVPSTAVPQTAVPTSQTANSPMPGTPTAQGSRGPWTTAPLPLPTARPSPPPSLELGWMATGAAVFDARTAPLVGRDELCDQLWQALAESAHQPVVLRLNGPAGVGITALLDDLARTADATGTATVLRTPEQPTTTRPTSLWVFDEPTEAALAFAQAPPTTGLILLGRGPQVGETIDVARLPISLRPALVRAMLPVQADVAGWIALRADGLPGHTRTRLHRLMADGCLTLKGRRYGWAPDRRPAPTVTDIAAALDQARAEFDQAANEQAWSRLLDVQATGRLQPGDPTHTTWLDLVGMLADRLPRDVPMHMLADHSDSPHTPPTADALYHRGVRALRRQQHDVARQLFEGYLARVEQPKERALGMWQLGAVAFGLGHYQQAYEYFVKARGLLQDGSDPVRLAHTLLALSLVESNLGQFETALDWAQQATAAFEAVGKPRHRANIADFESTCHLWLGRLDLAEARARESLDLYANDGSPNRLVPLLNLAAALHHQQRTALVREILDEVARRAGFEEPRLLGVVALYGALFAAQEAREHDWDTHWEGFEEVWATGVGWHPATARMLADIGTHVARHDWPARLALLDARLDQLRDRFGTPVLERFGVPDPTRAQ